MAIVCATQPLVIVGLPIVLPPEPPHEQADDLKNFPETQRSYRFEGLKAPLDKNGNMDWKFKNRAQPALWSQRQVTPASGGDLR